MKKTWRFIRTPLVSQCNKLKVRGYIVSILSDSADIRTLTRRPSDPVAYLGFRKGHAKGSPSHSCYHLEGATEN